MQGQKTNEWCFDINSEQDHKKCVLKKTVAALGPNMNRLSR
ncbi:hypothetical protein C4K22_0165 [Pseudomonas chlororaphis subsp. aurantiaca]|nr:hypothetical protein C4K22_0165 [Pseudomonas chlororaphis subsp. aurantiaca]AZD39270.1 hypothetical protein C4K21_0164 [Pseudomonas chlororaphis subsp. aurantiaca]AZD76762.1 hypothetical protein C4K15_0163 [Pseudomonas chlororaphis subsp. aurantiaca]